MDRFFITFFTIKIDRNLEMRSMLSNRFERMETSMKKIEVST